MKFGLLGHPLGHSFSPILHSYFGDYEYTLFDLPETNLQDFFKTKDFKGINVTIPYKEKVIDYLDEKDSSVDEIGSCNTIINNNGSLIGYNTDFFGLKLLIEDSGLSMEGKTVAILGTGGTSKTAKAVCASLGVKKTYIVSRNKKPGCISYDELYQTASDIDIILNATPVGMSPNFSAKPVDLIQFRNLLGVIDVIYNPIRSSLIQEATSLGLIGVSGLKMLAGQAFKASMLFQDKELDPSLLQTAYRALLSQKQNIVLIGMPSSGKSKLGGVLASKLNREYIDTDELFVKRMKMSIADYMSMFGEKNFRRIEKEIIQSLNNVTSAVISTGGGVVLDPENVTNLRYNGKIFFLDRPLDQLRPSSSRPLSNNENALKKMYETRYPIYLKAMDVRVKGGLGVEYEVNKVCEELGL